MSYVKAQLAVPQIEDANGNPASGYTISSYIWDTSTPTPMYTSSAGAGSATSFSLNSLGEPQTAGGTACDIFLDSAIVYKFIIRDAGGAQVGPTIGPVYAGNVSTYTVTADNTTSALALSQHLAFNVTIKHYGALSDGATDIATAVNNALTNYDHVRITEGDYAIGEMITLTAGKMLIMDSSATITRLASITASTDPIFWLKEGGSALIGSNRNSNTITTENASPLGVIRIGFEDETETGRVIRNCRLEHLKIIGNTGGGQTSGSPDVSVYIPCASGEQNYYHTIHDLMLSDSNHGIWLHGEANGMQISKIWGESMGNASMDGVMLYFQGGSDCSVSQAFMSGNGASGSGAIMLKFSNLGSSRSTHNAITGLVGEMGVNGLLVESTDTTTSAPVSNYIQGIDNTGGVNVNDDFWTNNFAAINDYPSTKGGFRFPLTPAPVSGSNILDYYSETQTYQTNPAIESATPGTGRSTTVNHAKWTRIGNICFISLRVTMASLGSGGSGNVRITNGLPFTCISDSGNYLGGLEVPNYENLAAGVRTIKAAAYPGSTDIALYITTSDATANAQMDFGTYIQATTQFYITGFYVVA